LLPWAAEAARSYGLLLAQVEAAEKSLELEDMLIVAHAIAIDSLLGTRNKDFAGASALVRTMNWATDV
jgi:predicted nucleic acid-binding protein